MKHEMTFEQLERPVWTRKNIQFSLTTNWYNSYNHPLYMDIVSPYIEPNEKLPVLLWICGGGWEVCEPENRLVDLALIAKRGYLVAMAQYRTSGISTFPAQIIDVKTAIRYLRANAEELRIDPDRIALMGDSAGGHLVTLAGLTPDKPEFTSKEYPGFSDRVQAVVDWYGVLSFTGMAENASKEQTENPVNCINKLFGNSLYAEQVKPLVELASPMNYITKDAPPFMILHGDKDPVVPYSQSVELYEKLTALGVPADLWTIKGAGHASPEFNQPKLLETIADFLDKHLKK